MKRFLSLITLVVSIILVCSCNNNRNPDTEIKQTISQFGKQLKKVSVLAPDSLLIPQMKQAYKPYITQELLQSWIENPSQAPGRKTSSPWPEKINIIQLTKIKNSLYKAKGKVVYITSKEKVNGGQAIEKTVVMEVEKMNEGVWKISKYMLVN